MLFRNDGKGFANAVTFKMVLDFGGQGLGICLQMQGTQLLSKIGGPHMPCSS